MGGLLQEDNRDFLFFETGEFATAGVVELRAYEQGVLAMSTHAAKASNILLWCK